MRFLITASIILLIISCNNKSTAPDVSDIKINLKTERFEQSFFTTDTVNLSAGLASVQQKFPAFYPFFTEVILSIPAKEPAKEIILQQVIRAYKPFYDSLEPKYRDINWLNKDLTKSFQYVKYYYPSYRIPAIITFIGTLDAPGIVLTPQYLGIGLQQFAGKNFSAYSDPEIQQIYPSYISRRFDKEYITPNAMKAIVDDLYPDTSQSAGLIDQMIERGKQWWLLDHFLPDAPDSLKTGYTGKQVAWVKANEGNIWGSIQSNTPDIYTLDQERIQNYIGEAPFTQNMEASNSSPGNIGQWVGWQIVKKFAEKNPELTLKQVLETPSRKIFQEAKYKPK